MRLNPLTILTGDALTKLRELPDESVQCCVTSPPYWGLRDYGTAAWAGGEAGCDHKQDAGGTRNKGRDRAASNGTFHDSPRIEPDLSIPYRDNCGKCGARRIDSQLGLEKTPDEYVAKIVEVFREVRRVLRRDGTLWLNLGSSYNANNRWGGEENISDKQRSNAGTKPFMQPVSSVSARRDVPSCGSDGKGLQDSRGVGRVCPDCGGELTACSPNHSRRKFRNGRPRAQSERQPSRKDHDSGRADCVATSPSASVVGVPESTIPASFLNVQDVSVHKDKASERPSGVSPSCADVEQSEHNSACISDTAQSDRPLASRMSDTAYVCMACGYSTRMFPPHKPKDLVNIPFMVAEALRADGWYLRCDIIWAKKNCMPESVTDRPTKAHEYLFLLTKSANYFYDAEAIKEPVALSTLEWGNGKEGWGVSNPNHSTPQGTHGPSLRGQGRCGENGSSRNKRTVWTVATAPYPEAHFATYPPDLIKPCIMAGTSAKGCCARCGAPWERIVQLEIGDRVETLNPSRVAIGHDLIARGHSSHQPGWRKLEPDKTKTLGWQPTCTCDAAVQPCVCLDPFAGSGTTGAVALELGRRAVLIELNTAYVKLIEQRCDVTPGLALA